jgi:hypothetical protein
MEFINYTSYLKQGYDLLFGKQSSTVSGSLILDPMSTIVKLAIYNYMPPMTKLRLTRNTIKYDKPDTIVPQGVRRGLQGAKKEDLHNLHIPIVKAIQWYLTENNQSIFKLAIQGLEKLNIVYADSSKIVSQALTLNVNIIKYNIKHTLEKEKLDAGIEIIEEDIENEEIIRSMIVPENEETREHDIYFQLQKLWNNEEIELIIGLFNKLESKKNEFERRGYLDAVHNIISGKDEQVATTLEKLITSL